jgi:polyhydroxybutyrate depolymerase
MWWRYYFEFSAPQPPALSGTFQTEHLKTDGLDRSFSLYVPSRVARNAPLIVALHGANSSGQALRAFTGYEFDVLADKAGFMVAYPDSFSGGWNDCRVASHNSARRQGIDDVTFIKSLIANLHDRFSSDGPVYVLGYSTGGLMVYRLAEEAPETFTAAAAISANLPTEVDSDCTPSRAPVSIAILNGTADEINPFTGGNFHSLWTTSLGNVRSAEQSALYFAALAGSADKPRIERLADPQIGPSPWAERRTWSDGRANIELLAIHGGGHTISQPFVRQPRILGPTIPEVDAPAEVWRFFKQAAERISFATVSPRAKARHEKNSGA